jgi:hypothetical protein
MISAADLIILNYDPQFSQAGVQYARDSLHFTYNRMGLKVGDRLRKIVAGVAFEMAVRRWLETGAIPYSRLGATPFTEPDRFDLAIGGRRCDLKSYLIYDRPKIRALHADPAWALEAMAMIPDDQFETERMGEGDLYLFGLVTGLEARHSSETEKALAKNLPVYLIHVLPRKRWASPHRWESLGRLAVKGDTPTAITVEIGGQGADRGVIREQIELPPRTRVEAVSEFFAVFYLSLPHLPDGAIALRSPVLSETYVVAANEWNNIWVYGQRVYLCGWLNKHDFRQASHPLPPDSPVKQYRRTATANRALLMRDLRPMAELAEIARKHAAHSL